MRRACSLLFTIPFLALGASQVSTIRVPNGGLQPQVVVDGGGAVHLLYYLGQRLSGDLFYVKDFGTPVRVNSQAGSAIAAGSIRGGQIALGKNGRVHVAWNGSGTTIPKGPANSAPMLYTRMNDAGTFEPQRNLMIGTKDLDGGGTLAASPNGEVWVAWHAHPVKGGPEGEAGRQVYLAVSKDDGKSFTEETPAWQQPTGACGCCGMKIFAGPSGVLNALYRSATDGVHRDMYLLTSNDKGKHFSGKMVQKWDVNACPMSSVDIVSDGKSTVAAWETAGQVSWGPVRDGAIPVTFTPAGEPGKRKHPRLAINHKGETILVWMEGAGMHRGGALQWQVFNAAGKPTAETGTVRGVPADSFAAVYARKDGSFTIVY